MHLHSKFMAVHLQYIDIAEDFLRSLSTSDKLEMAIKPVMCENWFFTRRKSQYIVNNHHVIVNCG